MSMQERAADELTGAVAFLKMTGVTPLELQRLHSCLPGMNDSHKDGRGHFKGQRRGPLLLSSVYDVKKGTYTVDLKLQVRNEGNPIDKWQAPRSEILELLDALQVFPEKT